VENSKISTRLSMNQYDLVITKEVLIRAKRIALRSGKWFKLSSVERLVLSLSIKVVSRVKSKTLKEILMKILDKISSSLLFKFKILSIGLEIAKKRVEQAIKLGYERARNWIKDINYIWYLGISYINTSPIYK